MTNEFVPWETHYEITKKRLREEGTDIKLDINYYLKWYVQFNNKYGGTVTKFPSIELVMVRGETYWLTHGKPYYNFHTNLIAPALRLKLNKFPMSLIDIPRNFKSVNLRFPKGYDIASILAFKSQIMLDDPSEHLILMFKTFPDGALGSISFPNDEPSRDIEDYLKERVYDAVVDSTFTKESALSMGEKAVRLYLITKFLADTPNEDLITFDVLSKYKSEYVTASPSRRKEIINESKRKGKLGWNIGVSELLVKNAPRLTTPNDSTEERGELTHSHIRTGHLHAVRCGIGKKDVKIMFFRPTQVRPDLPFKE